MSGTWNCCCWLAQPFFRRIQVFMPARKRFKTWWTPLSRACSTISASRKNWCRAGRKIRNDYRDSKMGKLRPLLAHGFRAAVRAGGDDGGGARPPRLAGLENLRIDSRRNDLRADVRDGLQPDC